MELNELLKQQKIIIQIIWGEKVIEFYTNKVEEESSKIYVKPYLHNGNPLELNIHNRSGVVCNLFADNPYTGKRVSWRNIDLKTVNMYEQTLYEITTSGFNKMAMSDERRTNERIQVHKKALAITGGSDDNEVLSTEVRVYDISSNGISFYAPVGFQPTSRVIKVQYSDTVRGEIFNIKVSARVVHNEQKVGTVFYGCEIIESNKDFMIYGCLSRVIKNSNGKAVIEIDRGESVNQDTKKDANVKHNNREKNENEEKSFDTELLEMNRMEEEKHK